MKISGRSELPRTKTVVHNALHAPSDSDLLSKKKPSRRKSRGHGISGPAIRVTRGGFSGGRSRPETPLLKWNFEDEDNGISLNEKSLSEQSRKSFRPVKRDTEDVVSARKLAGGLWRLRFSEVAAGDGGTSRRWENEDRLGIQSVGHIEGSFVSHCNCQSYKPEVDERIPSSHAISSPKNRFPIKPGQPFPAPNSFMERSTKWDPVQSETPDDVYRCSGRIKHLDKQASDDAMISALQSELRQAHSRIQELEMEQRSSKKKLEHYYIRKFNEEKAAWRSREQEKIQTVIDDIKADLSRERKNRQRMELVNSKLASELSDLKISAKRVMQDNEKERRNRELIEEVCDELVKEIGEDKAEIEAVRRESMKLREELEDERKMLQTAEVWREERVQMKLVDAKLALDEKYNEMKKLATEMEIFLRSYNTNQKETQEANSLLQAASSISIQELKEFSYEPPKPDDIFSVIDDGDRTPANPRVHNVSPDANKEDDPKNEKGDVEDDSGWETASDVDEDGSGSSYSQCSELSFNKNRRASNVSQTSDVCSVQTQKAKKSGISRFWKSCPSNGENYKIVSLDGIKGRLSNGSMNSVQSGQWMSSPESGGRDSVRRAKGCLEWPRKGGSLKTKAQEAKFDSYRIQLKHALKQKI